MYHFVNEYVFVKYILYAIWCSWFNLDRKVFIFVHSTRPLQKSSFLLQLSWKEALKKTSLFTYISSLNYSTSIIVWNINHGESAYQILQSTGIFQFYNCSIQQDMSPFLFLFSSLLNTNDYFVSMHTTN